MSNAARLCDGAVMKYILARSPDTFITDGMLEASAGLPDAEVMKSYTITEPNKMFAIYLCL
jgi:hypothetical protein